jgi:hypothetical protein
MIRFRIRIGWLMDAIAGRAVALGVTLVEVRSFKNPILQPLVISWFFVPIPLMILASRVIGTIEPRGIGTRTKEGGARGSRIKCVLLIIVSTLFLAWSMISLPLLMTWSKWLGLPIE